MKEIKKINSDTYIFDNNKISDSKDNFSIAKLCLHKRVSFLWDNVSIILVQPVRAEVSHLTNQRFEARLLSTITVKYENSIQLYLLSH